MRGSIRKRAEGSWSLTLELGYVTDPTTGLTKRKQAFLTVRGTKKEAEAKLTEQLRAVNRGEFVQPSKITLGEWLKKWVELRQGPKRAWSESTYVRFKGIIETHLMTSTVAAMPLQRVKAHHIEQYHADHRDTLSPGTFEPAPEHPATGAAEGRPRPHDYAKRSEGGRGEAKSPQCP